MPFVSIDAIARVRDQRVRDRYERRGNRTGNIEHLGCGLLNVRFAPESDRIADIAEGPSCAQKATVARYEINQLGSMPCFLIVGAEAGAASVSIRAFAASG
jgi:hypothetical protein